MKILHVAYSLSESSAATRLAESQTDKHLIYFLLGRLSEYKFVRERQLTAFFLLIASFCFRVWEKLLCIVTGIAREEMFSFGTNSILQRYILRKVVVKYEIDRVHLHWGGVGFMPIEALRGLNVQVVITAHDYHCFTGGCHIPMECTQFQAGCKRCPLTKSIMAQRYISKKFSQSSDVLRSLNLIVIAPSRYVKERIASVHPNIRIETVSNTLGLFHKLAGRSVESMFKHYRQHRISSDGVKTIIVVGVSGSCRQNKGKDVLITVISALIKKGVRIKLISIGEYFAIDGVSEREHLNSASSSDLMLKYAIADLCIVPSRYETFSQVTLEAIVCGTPVVAFDLTGPNDIIVHNISGFLVPSFDIAVFTRTVEIALEHKINNIGLMTRSALDALLVYSPKAIAAKHDIIYENN
jgi:glycosyltransferase involved in cell wall biosynthesis